MIRWAVLVVATFVLPAALSAVGYSVLTALSVLKGGEALTLACLFLFGSAGLGYFESKVYFRELRSVVPRPMAAAMKFLVGLALTLSAAGAALSGIYAASIDAGLGRLGLVPSAALSLVAYAVVSLYAISPSQEYVRGRKYRSFREVFLLSKLDGRFGRGEKIFFGGIHLPWSSAVKHWLVLGVTGSGKSMLFQLLMQGTLRGRVGSGRDERGLVYDNKTELVPVLSALGVPYKIMNPFDRRGVAVDFASLVPTHTAALEVASILMPRAKNVGSDPFWVEAPRNLLASVMTSLRLGLPSEGGKPTPIRWDFRDLVLVMQSRETIRQVIARHPQTKDDIEGYYDDPRLLANVMASVKTSMMYYRPIAACWHRSGERINLAEAVWGDDGYVLVLGNDEQFRKAIDPIVRVVVTRYGQLALKRPKSDRRRVWFFFDEFSDLKRLEPDLIMGLLTKGRSKGISVVLGIQSLSSVVGEYGREVAKVILSQCQNIAILGLGDLDDVTAEYATRVIGQIERLETRERESPDGLFARWTKDEELKSRSVVLSCEFSELPETVRKNGLAGYYRTRSIRGFWGAVLPGSFLHRELSRPDPAVPAVEERDGAEHELEPWSESERAMLGLGREVGRPSEDDSRRVGPKAKPFRVYRGGRHPAKPTGRLAK